jgi:hypothetical protein
MKFDYDYLIYIAIGIVCVIGILGVIQSSDSGALSPSIGENDNTIGTFTWLNPENIINDDSSMAIDNEIGTPKENSIRLFIGGEYIGDDKSTGATLPASTYTYISYGGATDKWGLTPTPAQINNATFGVGYSINKTTITNYLKATNFSFNIPTSATINGILVEVLCMYIGGATHKASVDHIRITVYYTEAGEGNCWATSGTKQIYVPAGCTYYIPSGTTGYT